jgi:uncharacterized membrane protein YeaQ/YmgE (transglycosylase-associated protein family)
MEIIGVIIAGIIIGLLGKFVAPGDKDNIPIWLTILCGIGGVILGWFITAAVLVMIASTVTGKNTGSRNRV